MSLTIELAPGVERSLQTAAAEQGIEAEELVRRWIEHCLETAPPNTSKTPAPTPEEKLRRMEAWIEGHRDWPVLDESANHRASYYE